MPDKKPVSTKAMRRYTRFGLPVDNPVARDATSVRIPSITPQEREAASYYNPPVKDVSSGDSKLDFLYRNQWLMKAPIVGKMIRNKAKDYAIKSDAVPVLENLNGVSSAENDSYKYQGSKNGISLVDQYFSKEPILKKSTYTPKSDYLEFLPSYSIKGDDSGISDRFKHMLSAFIEDYNEESKNPETIDSIIEKVTKNEMFTKNMPHDGSLAGQLFINFGGHKIGMAFDEEKGLPYMSVSDAWDFEPKNYAEKWGKMMGVYDKSYVQSSLMHKAGNPFKIYDRFYFDPETKEYIPDSEVASRKK